MTRPSFLVAVSENGVIGKDGKLPWHLPGDLHYFKQMTLGKPVLMGRLTFEACGDPLPGRHNIVVTSQRNYLGRGASIVSSVQEGLALIADEPEVVVIGGTRIFEETFPLASRIYLTEVHATVEGDTFYPDFDYTGWEEVSRIRHEADEENEYACSFVVLGRVIN